MDAFIYRGQLESSFFLNMSGCPLTVTQSRITLSSDGRGLGSKGATGKEVTPGVLFLGHWDRGWPD